jgi:hypothetical protein
LSIVNFVNSDDDIRKDELDGDGTFVNVFPLRTKIPTGTVAEMFNRIADMAASLSPLSEQFTFRVTLLSALRLQEHGEIDEGGGHAHKVGVSAERGVDSLSPQVPFLT